MNISSKKEVTFRCVFPANQQLELLKSLFYSALGFEFVSGCLDLKRLHGLGRGQSVVFKVLFHRLIEHLVSLGLEEVIYKVLFRGTHCHCHFTELQLHSFKILHRV